MKGLTGQNTLLAICVIAVFTISGCFFSNAEREMDNFEEDAGTTQSPAIASIK